MTPASPQDPTPRPPGDVLARREYPHDRVPTQRKCGWRPDHPSQASDDRAWPSNPTAKRQGKPSQASRQRVTALHQ